MAAELHHFTIQWVHACMQLGLVWVGLGSGWDAVALLARRPATAAFHPSRKLIKQLNNEPLDQPATT